MKKEDALLLNTDEHFGLITQQCLFQGICCADLVIIHLHSVQKLQQGLSVKFNTVVLPTTFISTLQSTAYNYLIFVLPVTPPRVGESYELCDASGEYKITLKNTLSWDFLATLLPNQLGHLHTEVHRLLQHELAKISQQAQDKLWHSIALANTDLLLLKDGRVYLHFTYPLFDCVVSSATLTLLAIACEPLTIELRFIQGHVYGLSQQQVSFQDIETAQLAVFTQAPNTRLVLALKAPRLAVDEKALLAVFIPFEPITLRAAMLSLEGNLVQGYCIDENNPYKALTLDVYLNGRYQQRLTADKAGVDINGKALSCGWAWQFEQACLQGDRYDIDVVSVDTQQRVLGSPYRLGLDCFEAHFQLSDGSCLTGQIKARSVRQKFPVFQLFIDGEARSVEILPVPSQLHHDLPFWRINVPLPPSVNDGHPHQLVVKFSTENPLIAPIVLSYQAHYVGVLERVDNELVSGWIYQKQAPTKAVNLDLIINGKIVATLSANSWPKAPVNASATSAPLACGFYFRIDSTTAEDACRVVALHIAGTNVAVLAPPLVFTSYDTVINTLLDAQASLLNSQSEQVLANGIQVQAHANQWLRQQILAPIIQALRTEKSIPARLSLDVTEVLRLPQPCQAEPMIDIILPVFKGLQETLVCIRSVLEHSAEPYQLIVINDASPDPTLTKMLQAWASSGAFTLRENPHNLGFVATVNHGMREHPHRDVVLLNADTVVTKGWLTRLHTAAFSAANIATVTPFSNNASLLSFPLSCAENPMPEATVLAQLAQHCATVNAGIVMNIPTAVGFCMYIKREALNDVGEFDESRFGKGYAEENDFCLRASALGWRHVAACDAFVAHHGAISFQAQKTSLMKKNLQQLQVLYPDYALTIERFTAQNPLRYARNRLSLAALKSYAKGYLLFITHDAGGGTQKHVDELAKRLQNNALASLALTRTQQGHWQLRAYGQAYCLCYQGDNAFEEVLRDLKQLGIWHAHFHHVLHLPHAIWTVPEHLGVEYDVTLHDYYTVCPSINMIDESKHYCGESQLDVAACDRCLRINPLNESQPGLGLPQQLDALGGTMTAWRNFYGANLRAARQVFAPSQATATLVCTHYPLKNIRVQAHPEDSVVCTVPRYQTEASYRIAIIGAIGEHKGYSLLLNCAKAALKQGLPLEFIVFGYTLDDQRLERLANVHVAGVYTQDELPQKLATWPCQVAAFLSVWPETFSYTLSEAWQAGLYPVAFDLGALAERIRHSGYGRVLPLTLDAQIINAALMASVTLVNAMTPSELHFGHEYADILNDYYQLDIDRIAHAPLTRECHAQV